jgi:hypothetical protein
MRIQADYRPDDVSDRSAAYVLRRSDELVNEVSKSIGGLGLAEVPGEYGARMTTRKKRAPEELVNEATRILLEHYPDLEIRVKQRGERDFTIEAFGDYPEMWQVSRCLGDMQDDALVDDDVWILVLGLPRSDN